MNKEGNTYTYLYASVMVILVAGILASISLGLQTKQKSNIEQEKMQNILKSVQIFVPRNKAKENFNKYIVDTYVVNSKGKKIKNIDAFSINIANEIKKSIEDRILPVFIFKDDKGEKTIIPVYGKGMWGPLWGFIAFKEDRQSIYGVNFDHKSETPGLGAEISTQKFQNQFKNKRIFNSTGLFVPLKISKKKSSDNYYTVDAITGGTITSKKLEKTLQECLNSYQVFLKNVAQNEEK